MADNDPLNDIPRQRLCEFIQQYGPSICQDVARCEKLLRNLCGNFRREVFLLLSALHNGVVADMLATRDSTNGPLLTTLTRRMHEELTIAPEACEWAVRAWAEALGITSGKTVKDAPAKSEEADQPRLPPVSAEHRRIAVAQFEKANQVIASGNHDYGIELLMTCCKIDPGNLIYRQALRKAQKAKYKNNMRGAFMATISNSAAWAKLKTSKQTKDHLKVLLLGEEILGRNPWDMAAQLDMAEAADALGLLDVAIWILEEARRKDAHQIHLNRALARLYEKRGNLGPAIAMWDLVRKADPADKEAGQKTKDLAANATIQRGKYDDVESAPERSRMMRGRAAPVGDRLARELTEARSVITTDPTQPGAYLQLAAIHRREGQMEQARAVLQEGLAAIGNDFEIAVQLAELELEPFRRDLALIEDRLDNEPDNDNLRRARIRYLKEINSRELELFRQKADRFPLELTYRLELGIRLLRAGQSDEAIRELQAARADTRCAWRAFMYLGFGFKSRGNWRLAQRNFEEALKNLPATEEDNRKEILFQLAQGCADASDWTAAIDWGHELANLDFSYRDIGRLLDEWQPEKGDATRIC